MERRAVRKDCALPGRARDRESTGWALSGLEATGLALPCSAMPSSCSMGDERRDVSLTEEIPVHANSA